MLDIKDHPSPNFDARPEQVPVDMIVLHYTGMRSADEALDRLSDPAAKVSAHYLIDEDGRVFRLVAEAHRAWHAGVSCWHGVTDINGLSIGIELQNPGDEFGYRAFPEPQVRALLDLACEIRTRHDVPPERVLGHSDVAPDRKQDPGILFPWCDVATRGLGLWPIIDRAPPVPTLGTGESGLLVERLQSDLARYGYDLHVTGNYGSETECVVKAFQRHWRPSAVNGRADGDTQARLQSLLTMVG